MGDHCLHDYLDGLGFRPLAARVVHNIVVAIHGNEKLEELCCSTGFLEWPRWQELKPVFDMDATKCIMEEENLEAAVLAVVLPLIHDLKQHVENMCGTDAEDANAGNSVDDVQTPLLEFSQSWPTALTQCKIAVEMHCRENFYDIEWRTLQEREWVQLWHGWSRLSELMRSGDGSGGECLMLSSFVQEFTDELMIFYGLLSMNEVAPEVQTEEARLAELRIAYSLRPGFAITKNIQS